MDNETRGARILVAEDDQALLRLLEIQLQASGYDVRTASDGTEALEIAHDWRPDALLCDVMMPRTSGLTVTREFRADPVLAEVPIVLLTARVFDEDIEQVVRLGGVTFMSKPFDLMALHDAIAAALRTVNPTATIG